MRRHHVDLRSKIEFLLTFGTDAVFLLDDRGMIQAVNDEGCRLLGCEREILLGASLRTWRTEASIRPHPDLDRPDTLCYSALFKRHPSGTFLGDMSVSTVTEGNERIYIATLRDMTWHSEATYKQNLAAAVFDNSIQAIMVTDAANLITAVNPAFEQLTGYAAEEVIGHRPSLLQSGRHDKTFYTKLWRSVLDNGRWEGEIWDKRKNGEIFPEWLTISVVRDAAGAITHHVAICHDITERKQADTRLRHITDFYSALCQIDQLVATRTPPQNLFDGICRTSVECGHLQCACISTIDHSSDTVRMAATFCDTEDGTSFPGEASVLWLSRAAIRAAEAVVAQEGGISVFPTDIPIKPFPPLSAAAFPFKRGGRISGALTVFSGENAFFDNELLHLLRRIAEDISFALDTFDQETLRQAAESRANYLAQHDILTGLQRRNVLEDAMAMQHARSLRESGSYALALIDLDHFKVINDSYGHGIGDEVLIHVAKILRNTVRIGDWIGRWGGEEFLCLLPETSPEAALHSMERLRQQLAGTPHAVGGHELRVTASIGIAFFPSDGAQVSDLMARVDTALYQAKQDGGNCVRQAGLSPNIFLIGGQIEEALGAHRVLAATQPIVSLLDHTIVADESLARLRLPNGQILDAAQFIEAAAHLGQLQRIDKVVIELAMRRCLDRLKAKSPSILHFVNASAELLAHPETLATLLDRAKQQRRLTDSDQACGAPFVIEITERAMLRNRKAVKRHLAPLLDHGFRIALDDFGSGYSSLLYLADFPVSFLKIEQQLITRITTDNRTAAIIRNVACLGHDLGITTIAEGIEDHETADALRDLGIDWGQGYYFARPLLM